MRICSLIIVGACALLAVACVGSSGAGGGVATTSSSSSGASSSGASSSGASSSGASSSGGDATKTTADIKAKDDTGTSTDVKIDKPASKADADKGATSKNGAQNADKELIIWLTSGDGTATKVIEIHVNTAVHQLPAKGIKLGEALSDAWVTYTVASATGGGIYETVDKGTLDIDTCPDKEGVAVVGQFNGVVVVGKAVAVGAKDYTLDGAFNAVYYGSAGALNCKPPDNSSSGGTTSGGTTSGGTSSSGGDTSVFTKPTGAKCDATICDGGVNKNRNCCPWLPCLDSEMNKCLATTEACIKECGQDFSCFGKCTGVALACVDGAPVVCEVNAPCKTAMTALATCRNAKQSACEETSGGDEDKEDACTFDACCAETKATF